MPGMPDSARAMVLTGVGELANLAVRHVRQTWRGPVETVE